jgi:hypothetical protein
MAGSRSGYQACALIPHRTGAARNGGVMTPFYRVGEGEERVEGRHSSGGRQRFDGLQWGNTFAP